jgi:mannose/cellobiose epimerase-like protein (N-acyl-D-glucosamine 2-epimerase family)
MDQAAAGVAYLDAYAATKEARHLERAESLAGWIRTRLEDRRGGGFHYAPRDASAIGRLAAGEKPENGNLEAGWLFLRLWEVKRRPEDRRAAQRTLDYLRSGEVVALDPAQAELGLRLKAAAAAP